MPAGCGVLLLRHGGCTAGDTGAVPRVQLQYGTGVQGTVGLDDAQCSSMGCSCLCPIIGATLGLTLSPSELPKRSRTFALCPMGALPLSSMG